MTVKKVEDSNNSNK